MQINLLYLKCNVTDMIRCIETRMEESTSVWFQRAGGGDGGVVTKLYQPVRL